MKSIREIIKSFGSIIEFSNDVGINYNTAKTMSARKAIAPQYWPRIVEAAEKKGIHGITLECLATIRVDQAKKRS